jgi:hypothetical protein
VEGNGPSKTEPGGVNVSIFLTTILKGKADGEDKEQGVPEWSPTTGINTKGRCGFSTVLTESTFITGAIAASEHREVRCYNVPSAFVNTNVDNDVLMVLKGELAEVMIQIAPQGYRKYVTVDKKGVKLLYLKLQKALYGLMRASLLFYRKLQKEFDAYGLKVNPYNPCVANMETKSGKQLTVIWHVDNLMALCKDDFELTKFLCYLGKIYGTKLSMHTGQKHNSVVVTKVIRDADPVTYYFSSSVKNQANYIGTWYKTSI